MYPHERSLVKKLADKPFALIGVNSDRDLEALKPVLEKEQITWRSFWNGPKETGGPISEAWNVQGWPTLYVIDHKGVIRHKYVGSPGDKVLDDAIEKLVREAEKDGKPGKCRDPRPAGAIIAPAVAFVPLTPTHHGQFP
jgi:hypothetical protein